jgi:uncharacterized protein (TIGR02646 family)
MGIFCGTAWGGGVITVTMQNAPSRYAAIVQARGARFLAQTPHPSPKEWKRHAYWRSIHDDLYNLYGGICMYCASWSARTPIGSKVDHTSVDHFVPKSVAPQRAYEWTNFRLCRSRLNHRKANFQDVLDPFLVRTEWFTLQFTTFLIVPTPGLASTITTQVQATISRLQLNMDTDYVNERVAVVREYSLNKVTFPTLRSKYPFIADQMERQSFDRLFKTRFEGFFRESVN